MNAFSARRNTVHLLFLKDVAVFSAAQAIAGVALLGYTCISARLLGRADYGLFQAVMGIYGIFIVVGSPLNIVTLHLVAKAKSDAKPFALGALVRVALVIGGACSLLVIVLSSYFANVLHIETLWPFVSLAGLVVAAPLLTTFYGGVQGRSQYSFFSIAKIAESLLVVGLGTALIVAGAGVAGAVSGYFGGMALVSLFFLTRRDLYSFRKGSYSTHIDLYSVTKPLAVFGALLFVANAPMIVARARLTEEAAGLFGALYSLRSVVLPFAFAVALPLYSRTVSGHGEPRMVLKAFLLVIMLAGAFLAVGAISPRWFIQTLYGSDFVEASAYMTTYGFYLLLHMICMVVMFRQAATNTLIPAWLLIPITIVATLATIPDLSIRKILITQIVAWISYLGSLLVLRILPLTIRKSDAS